MTGFHPVGGGSTPSQRIFIALSRLVISVESMFFLEFESPNLASAVEARILQVSVSTFEDGISLGQSLAAIPR